MAERRMKRSRPIAHKKVWGTTELLVATPMFEMHRLRVKPKHRCSFHVHRFKHNAFYILSGELFIDSAKRDFDEPISVRLGPGDVATLTPGVHHQFRTGAKPCIALEMYYTEALSEDIIRMNVGEKL